MTTLLVTGAGGPAGRALGAQLAARAAGGADLTWVGVDIVPVDDPNYPASDHAPRADSWDYATGMRDLVVKHAPDLVVPTVQDELPQVAVLAQALDHTTTVLTAAPGPAALAADKLLTMLALDRAGVPVPRYALPTDFESVEEALAWAHGPVVIKPRVSRGGRGVRLIESAADLSAPVDPGDLTGPAGPMVWTALNASWIVQTFAEGTEYCPQLFRSASAGTPDTDGIGGTHGTTVVVLEKTVLKQGRVGNAAAVVRPAAGSLPDVEDVARRAVAALGLTGPADLDIRRDATGAPLVLEVNGRFGANSEHAPELLDVVLTPYQSGAHPRGTHRPAQAPR
ncbi:ATP-grasp domain-containing protein [Promicromonospora sukumoe]|uniref:ATP-grasp domain-containing protein n=1 Tax=Promicromonospora sukumoe TaxID=88382 RepID=UPI00365D609A